LFTRRAIGYFLLAISLLALALLLNDFEIGILVLGLSSLFFLSNLFGLPEKVEIKLDRAVIPDETFGEEDVRVESRVENLTSTKLVNVEIIETIDNRIAVEKGTSESPTVLEPNERFSLTVEFPAPPRADYKIGPLKVRVRDPFGLYLKEVAFEPQTLYVMPSPDRLRRLNLRPRHVGPWPGTILSKMLGIGTEFYSLREYVPGDDPKRINWKASAKNNQLIINETEAERVTDVMVVLDTDVTLFGPTEGDMFERGIHAAASICTSLLRQGNRVGLVLQGGERGSIPAGFGKRHERRLLYLLAAAKPGRASVSTSYVMNLLARRILPSRAQVVVISPLLDPEIKDGVRQLIIAGYGMLVLSPTPATPAQFENENERIAFKMIMLERSINLLGLEKSATVIDWPQGVPLSAVMTRVREIRQVVLA
jgi:uncharacterized protein (DUF58 family)